VGRSKYKGKIGFLEGTRRRQSISPSRSVKDLNPRRDSGKEEGTIRRNYRHGRVRIQKKKGQLGFESDRRKAGHFELKGNKSP